MRFRGAVSGAVEAVWDARRQLLGTLEAVLGHVEAGRARLLHEKMHAPACTLFRSFRPPPWAQVASSIRNLKVDFNLCLRPWHQSEI